MNLKSSSVLAQCLFKLFDVTQTKRINFRTWVTTLSALSKGASVDDKIKFSFSLYDINGDGTIDKKELSDLLIAAVRENVVALSGQEIEEIVRHTLENCDKDGNGTVDYSEYDAMVRQSPKFLECFSLDVSQICESYKRVLSMRIHEEDAKKRRERLREKEEKKKHRNSETETRPETTNIEKDKGGKFLAPPLRRQQTHAPKDLDLNAEVVDIHTRKLSDLFDPDVMQAAVAQAEADGVISA